MRRRWVVPALLAGAVALSLFTPFRWRCPVAAVLGVPCPTCGMTRATTLALRGDFAGATALHPLVWIVVPLVLAFLVVETLGYLRTGAWGASARVRGATAALVVVAVLVFLVWIARFCGALGGPAPIHAALDVALRR